MEQAFRSPVDDQCAAGATAGRRPRRLSRRQSDLALATKRRKFRAEPAYPAARASGSSRLAEIRPAVLATRAFTTSTTTS